MNGDRDTDIARISALLKLAIKVAGRSRRSVERGLGVSAGYLSALFAGRIKLKVRHVLDISEEIQLPPAEFFQFALPCEGEFASPTGRKLFDLVSRIEEANGVRQTPGPFAVSPEQLQDMVRSAVRELLADLGRYRVVDWP